jgi:hypothetical protein
MLTQMDTNNSLKRIQHVSRDRGEDGNLLNMRSIKRLDQHRISTDYYLSPEEVDKYQHEVKKCLPKTDSTVSPTYKACYPCTYMSG